jgi:hypothetical protein
LYSKILIDCAQHRIDAAFDEYVECEQEVRKGQSQRKYYNFSRIASILFGEFFSRIDQKVYLGEIRPKHGSGATADFLKGNQKYHQKSWPCRLEPYFPYGEMVLPNWSFWEQLGEVDFLEPDAEIPVQVVSVPKTMKSPRIIAMEPTAMQYAQQAILREIQETIKEFRSLDSFMGLDDQTPNQRLCKQGSEKSDLATLDLSEASDRVSCEIVSTLLKNHRHLSSAVFASRSTKARLPSGEVLTLAKFASMGSALCFPMEAAVFLVAIFVGIEQDIGHLLSRREINSYIGKVRVFGDDIIVPVDHVHSVIASLEYFGLKVNRRKSFWKGKFRESCGKEYYAGTDVSIVRCRRVLPSSRRDVREIVSANSLRNQLFETGYERGVDVLDKRLCHVLRHYPFVGTGSPVLGRLHYSPVNTGATVKNSIPKVKGWMIRSKIPFNEIDGWPALRKCLSILEERKSNGIPKRIPVNFLTKEEIESGLVATSPDHLRRSGRPRVVDIKLGLGHTGE